MVESVLVIFLIVKPLPSKGSVSLLPEIPIGFQIEYPPKSISTPKTYDPLNLFLIL